MNLFQSPFMHLADELRNRHDRQVLVEQLEWSALNDIDRLIEEGEYARVENIIRETMEKLSG